MYTITKTRFHIIFVFFLINLFGRNLAEENFEAVTHIFL